LQRRKVKETDRTRRQAEKQADILAKRAERETEKDYRLLAKRRAGEIRKERADTLRRVRETERLERAAEREFAKQEANIQFLTDPEARAAIRRIQSEESKAIAKMKTIIRPTDKRLDRDLAESLVIRAKTLGDMPTNTLDEKYAKYLVSNQLMEDIHSLVPPTAWDNALSWLNLPRALKANFDLSFPLRQGGMQWTRKEWRDMFATNVRSFISEEVAQAAEARVLFGRYANVRSQSGLEFVSSTAPLQFREEQYMTRFAGKIPGAKQSQRAYVTSGNVLRADVWDNIVEGWLPSHRKNETWNSLEELAEATGKNINDFEVLAKWMNVTTGRGDLSSIKWLQNNIGNLNMLFFAPRFFISRYQVLWQGGKIFIQHPALRKEITRDLVGFVAQQIMIMGGLKMFLESTGLGSVEIDPRSSDFAKGHIGPVRFEMGAGFQPLVRYTAQLIKGEGKAVSTGRIYDKERQKTIEQYARSKLNVPVGTAADIIHYGQNFVGEPIETPMDVAKEIALDFVPFVIEQTAETWMEAGPAAAVATLPIEFFGGTTAAYHSVRDTQDKVSQELYGKDYLDALPSERFEVNESIEVRSEIAQREGFDKPRYIEKIEDYNAGVLQAEGELKKFITVGATGEVLREAIKDFKDTRFKLGRSTFTDDVVMEMHKGLERSLKDLYRDRYWDVTAKINYLTGEIDFAGQRRGREAVLEEARRVGVDTAYITDKKPISRDSEVRRVIEEFERDQDTLRPYWEIREQVEAERPDASERLKNFTISARRLRMRRRDKGNNPVQQAGERWEYFGDVPSTLPRLPRLPSLIPRLPRLPRLS
jgi:hypothetical protein